MVLYTREEEHRKQTTCSVVGLTGVFQREGEGSLCSFTRKRGCERMVVRKKFWVVMAAGMMLLALVATTGVGARAATGSAPLAGTWEVGDHSQGGWAGGNLLPGGSLNGGGQISFHTPDGQQQVAQIDVKHST